jgi:hypothetical protein
VIFKEIVNMIASLKQLLYPKEFRIRGLRGSLKNFNIEEIITRYEELVKSVSETPISEADANFVKEIVTSIWRLEKRMEQYAGDPEFSRVKRALNLMRGVLNEYKIEIKDLTGKTWGPPYDEMLWDDVKGGPIQKKGIIRMMEPYIRQGGTVIQRGKIIIEEVNNEK